MLEINFDLISGFDKVWKRFGSPRTFRKVWKIELMSGKSLDEVCKVKVREFKKIARIDHVLNLLFNTR